VQPFVDDQCFGIFRAQQGVIISVDTRLLDVTRMRSIRNGQVHDLYYYCSICSIKTVAPGPCMCCQGPVELVEKPLSESAAE
jgi:hypothetical protein